MSNLERTFIRSYNRYHILDTIRAVGMISRIDLTRRLGLSKTSLSDITADLIGEGLVIEKEMGPRQVGRQPILLSINPEGAYAVGVSIAIHQIQSVIINFQAEVKAAYTLPLQEELYSPNELAEKIKAAVEGCIATSKYSKSQMSGVGVSVPGLVDSKSGLIRYMPNYNWIDVQLKAMVRQKTSLPTFIDNEANNAAISEQWFGKGRESENFIVVTIDNGVGAGIVINGRLVRGNLGIAAEFGHLSVDSQGPYCRCGKRGCIEAYAGINALIKDAYAILSAGMEKSLPQEKISFHEVVQRSNEGSPELKKMFAQAGATLGTGILHLIVLLNPEKIIITGMGVEAGPLLFKPMLQAIKKGRSSKFGRYKTDVLINEWTHETYAKGAGTLVLQEIYKSPSIKR